MKNVLAKSPILTILSLILRQLDLSNEIALIASKYE